MKLSRGLDTFLITALLGSLLACSEPPVTMVGVLRSDRVELVAESNEAIVEMFASEGQSLAAQTPVLQQDTTRLELQLKEVTANTARLEALLREQENGPLPEVIQAARLTAADASAEETYRRRELERLDGLRARNLTSAESVDLASRQLEAARAAAAIATVRLQELQRGTREEQLDQTRQQLAQSRAQAEQLALDMERATIRAPVAGLLDSLPFEIGERPKPGDVVAVLLIGAQPKAWILIPETLRTQYQLGDPLTLTVDGLEQPLTGHITRIANEAAFTPYYALTENERGRLSYNAEVSLPDLPLRLPEALPVQVFLDSPTD